MILTHNVIALDVGDRRIGVALASLEARMPSALLTLDRLKVEDIYLAIEEIINKYEANAVVVGLPRGMSGQETAQTKIASDFASELGARLNIVVHMQDEAGTSLMAEDNLKLSGKPYEKADIDKQAAKIILSDWLAVQDREADK